MSSTARHMTPPPVQSLRRLSSPSRWWSSLPWVVLLGLLAILRVSSLARLSELDWESRRQDRLILAQDMRRGELLRERAELTSNERLTNIAAAEHMVPPATVKPLQLSAAIPAPKIIWELPDESSPTRALNGQLLGFLSIPPSPSAPSGP